MTIENLKQIAIKYASTKGSRIPLAPDELCNAVVQYMNSFFGVMTDINTIKVAVTEDSGNIVFTITGNTYDSKPITPIVITVDHNDFVTDQEFEEFKTTTNAAIQKNTESINSLSFRVEDTENDITTIQVQVGQINTRVGNTETDVTKLKNRVDNTETNIAKINSTLNNKLDKVSSTTGVPQVYVKEYNGTQTMLDLSESTRVNSIPKRSPSGRMYTNDGISSEPSSVANMQNIADVEAKIPDVSNFATKDEIPDVSGFATTEQLQEVENKIPDTSNLATKTELQEVESKIPDTTNFATKDEIPDVSGFATTEQLQEVENKIPDTSNLATKTELQEVESKIPDTTNFADVTKANTFMNVNTFNNSIYAKNGIVAENTTNYGANSIRKGPNTYSFPNKSGTFAMTTDVIKDPIYFISFYINAPDETLHLTGTMISKNSYGTGQKTNEEFAVMLADNLYTSSEEGLAVYGKLVESTEKVIICIYSDDGLAIRYLDEKNSDFELPTAVFFVMETEL